MGTREYRSGWCGSASHDRCPVLSENGARAQERYVVCACPCHYPVPGNVRQVILDGTGHWGEALPDADLSRDDVRDYLAAINTRIRGTGADDAA